MIHVVHFKDPIDFNTQESIVRLYEGTFPIAPVLHQVLTNTGMMNLFIAIDDESSAVLGAGVLKIPEAAVPIGADIRPLAWVISDMVTHPEHRQKGIAKQILHHMAQVAWRNGARILYLYTENTNEPAKRLYEGAGFQRLADQHEQAIFVKLLMG